MWFFKRNCMKVLSIKKALGGIKIPKKIDKTRLEELVKRLRAGDRSVSNEIIEGHIRLAIRIVGLYAWYGHRIIDELIGESLYGLTQAVNNAPEKLYDDNITLAQTKIDKIYLVSSGSRIIIS